MAEIDKQDAQVNPSREFDTPEDVVKSRELSRDEKKKALQQWEIDARLMQVASEEGMAGGAPNRLSEVKKAQKDLGVADEQMKKGDHNRPAPPATKTGVTPRAADHASSSHTSSTAGPGSAFSAAAVAAMAVVP